jgi:hypothetical protein
MRFVEYLENRITSDKNMLGIPANKYPAEDRSARDVFPVDANGPNGRF